MIEKIREYYDEWQRIEDSYRGDKTDWAQKADELEILWHKIDKIKIRDTKNAGFYRWIQRQLLHEVREEFLHVWKLSIK